MTVLLRSYLSVSLCAMMFVLLTEQSAYSQHTDIVDESQTQVLADTTKSYFLPDVKKIDWAEGKTKFFTFKLGFVPILDYNLNIQNDLSKEQVGEQESRFDIRSARVSLRGNLNFSLPWSYLFSIEYKGFDRTEDMPAFGITDLKIVIPFTKQNELVIGYIKETFVYEMVGDAANLPHQERFLSPFFVSRNNGLIFRQFFMKDRMSLSFGWFNKWPFNGKSFDNSPNTFTARITGIPVWENNGKQFIHMGVSARYAEADNGKLRLKGKNESNISSNYVDTKEFTGSHQWIAGLEQLWSLENFSVLAEYVHNWSSTPKGAEQFSGYYITSSYVISGEQRPYDKRAAYARRVKPDGKAGAFELWSRVGMVDLNDKDIQGGKNVRYTFGLNWWATQYWKLGFNYGVSNLDRDDKLGVTNSFQWRLQWIY